MAKIYEKVETKSKIKLPPVPGKIIKAEIPKPAFPPKPPVFNDKGEKGKLAKKKGVK